MKPTILLTAMIIVCSMSVSANVTSDLAGIEARYKACEAKNSSGAGMTDCAFAAKSQADKLLACLYFRAYT